MSTGRFILLIVLGVFALQHLGMTLRFPPANITAFWTGWAFALAALLVSPFRRWPAALAAILAGFLLAYRGDSVVGVRVVLITYPVFVVTLTAGAWIIRRFGGLPLLDAPRSMLVCIGATLVMPIPTAALAGIMIPGGSSTGDQTFLVYLACTVGTLAAAPAYTGLLSNGLARLRAKPPPRLLEAAGVGFALIAVANVAMSQPATSSLAPALSFAPLPLLLWAAGRFGPAGASWGLIVVGYIAAWHAVQGRGPFLASGPETIIALELTLLAISLPVLILAALARERERTSAALEASGRNARARFAQLSTIYRTAPVGLAFVDRQLRCVSINDRLAEFDGLAASDHIGRQISEVAGAWAVELEHELRRVIETGRPVVDREIRGATAHEQGGERDWITSYHPVTDGHGEVAGVNIVVSDITERTRAEVALRESKVALRESYAAVDDLAARLVSAQEEERSRIARELHDNVNQRLAAISIALSELRHNPSRHPHGPYTELAAIQARINALCQEIRQLSHELHPGVLRHAGLVPAMRSACADLNRLHAAAITFAGPETLGELPDHLALCLYRVGQEALQNVVSHSGARHARVSIIRNDTEIELIVEDDGRGFDASDLRRRGGLGLISIQERVQLVHGTVRIEAYPQRGTVLRVRVPVPAGADVGAIAPNVVVPR